MKDSIDDAGLKRFYSLYPAGTPPDQTSVPIFINCFNRLTVLRGLVEWLLSMGQQRLVLLDNKSSYPPLLNYYQELSGDNRVVVAHLDRNLGHHALWASGVLDRLGWDQVFAYTDPDVLPDAMCPRDFLSHFSKILEEHPRIMKVGFGLKIDDIPDCYKFKDDVIVWEKQFWDIPVGPGFYLAPIDTTFALYRGGPFIWTPQLVEESKLRSIRTGAPYIARHLDWYTDSNHPTEEHVFYRAHAVPGITTWSLDALPPNVAQDVEFARKGARMIPLPRQPAN